MNDDLLDLLQCPFCRTFPFELIAVETEHAEVITGILFCTGCRRWFPVQRGIPSILPDNLRNTAEIILLEKIRHQLPKAVFETARGFSLNLTNQVDPLFVSDRDKRVEMDLRDRESDIYDLLYPDDKFKTELEIYDRLFTPSKTDRVLELGCGTGRVTRNLLGKCPFIVGFDLSYRSLVFCRNRMARFGQQTPQLVQGDVCYLPFRRNVFDQVVSLSLFCTLPGEKMRRRGLANAARVLTNEGTIIISVHNFSLLKRITGAMGLNQTGRKEGYKTENNSYYYNHDPMEFLTWLESYFKITAIKGVDHRVPVLQHLSARLNACLDGFIARLPLSLPVFAREMVAKGFKK